MRAFLQPLSQALGRHEGGEKDYTYLVLQVGVATRRAVEHNRMLLTGDYVYMAGNA